MAMQGNLKVMTAADLILHNCQDHTPQHQPCLGEHATEPSFRNGRQQTVGPAAFNAGTCPGASGWRPFISNLPHRSANYL